MPSDITGRIAGTNITGRSRINNINVTTPLEVVNTFNSQTISIKGISTMGTASQILRVKSDASGLEFHTLEVADLDSVETFTNKTLSTNCSYTGNVIAKAYLDTTLVDLSTSQTVLNKTFQNSSLNHNSNQDTNIGTSNKGVNIYGFLNLNTSNDRAVISYNGDDNHSIFLRRDIAGVDNRISFYEWDTINFYTGNALNINAQNMPLRLSINQTNISLLVNTTVNGTFSANGVISGSDAAFSGGVEGQSFSTRNIYLQETTVESGFNYINIKAPNSLTSNFTLNVQGKDGTIALTSDIPSITANNPMSITGDVISIGGLTNFGSANQIIKVNSTGDGFVYADLPNIPNFNTEIVSATSISTASILFNPATNIGNTGRNLNLTSALMFLNCNGASISFSNNSVEKFNIASSQTTVKNKMLVVEGSKTSITSDAICEFSKSGLVKVLLNSEATGGDCELAFQTINNSTTYSGRLYYRNNDRGLDLTGFSEYNFEVGSTNKFIINSGINISKNVLLVSNSATSRDDNNTNFEVNNGSGFTKMLLKTTATNQDVELAFKNGNTQGNIRMLNGDNSLEFNSFSGYTFKTSSNDRFIINGTNISRSNLLVSNNSTGLESNSQFQVDSGGATKAVLKTSSTNQDIELAFKNGNQQGQLKMLGSSNALHFESFSAYVFNTYTKINYNTANSYLALTSSVTSAKVGLNLFQGSSQTKLYTDFSDGSLVYESNNAGVQAIRIKGTNPSLIDENGRGLVYKFSSVVYCGNSTDRLSLEFGPSKSVFVNSSGDLKSLTFNSYSWKTSVGELVFQSDRNLVIYDSNNNAIFASNTSTSDRDKKENIVELEQNESIDIVKQLKTYRYNYIDDTEKTPQIGFMADETKPLIPECIKTITNGDKVSNLLFKENTIPHLVNSIQSLLSKVELLESRIQILEGSTS